MSINDLDAFLHPQLANNTANKLNTPLIERDNTYNNIYNQIDLFNALNNNNSNNNESKKQKKRSERKKANNESPDRA